MPQQVKNQGSSGTLYFVRKVAYNSAISKTERVGRFKNLGCSRRCRVALSAASPATHPGQRTAGFLLLSLRRFGAGESFRDSGYDAPSSESRSISFRGEVRFSVLIRSQGRGPHYYRLLSTGRSAGAGLFSFNTLCRSSA
jgi:hypothetical protein